MVLFIALTGCTEEDPSPSLTTTTLESSPSAAVSPGLVTVAPGDSPRRAARKKWMNAMISCMADKGWKLTPNAEADGPGFSSVWTLFQRNAMR